jgi:HEAT repeat protein
MGEDAPSSPSPSGEDEHHAPAPAGGEGAVPARDQDEGALAKPEGDADPPEQGVSPHAASAEQPRAESEQQEEPASAEEARVESQQQEEPTSTEEARAESQQREEPASTEEPRAESQQQDDAASTEEQPRAAGEEAEAAGGDAAQVTTEAPAPTPAKTAAEAHQEREGALPRFTLQEAPGVILDEETREQLRVMRRVQEFILSFIKAMLRTGYYDPEHPRAVSAKQGLYAQFQDLLEDRRELTFLIKVTQESREAMIDGHWEEPKALREIMTPNMADIFIPKFTDFFHRRRLRSCTMKREITPGEFDKFIDVMSYNPVLEKLTLEEEREKLIRTLRDNRIFSVSVIFEEDILGGKRRLPWRVELAITRLSKDLATIPLYRDITPQRKQEIKLQIFEDIFRPLKRADIIGEILFNVDLIQERLQEIEELRGMDIEKEVIGILSHGVLAMTAEDLIREYKSLYLAPRRRFGFEPHEARERTKTILIKIATHLLLERPPEADRLLETMYREGVIRYDDLPEHIQEMLRAERLTDAYLEAPVERIEAVGKMTDATMYRRLAEEAELIFGELLKRGKVMPLYDLYKVYRDHERYPSRQLPERRDIAGELLTAFRQPDNLILLRQALNEENKTLRNAITEMLADAGPDGVPLLLDILRLSENCWLRKAVMRHIEEIGPKAKQHLLEEIWKPDHQWYFYRNLLLMLGNMACPEATQEATRFLYHAHPAVRVEALLVLVKLQRKEAIPHLLQALDDKSPIVLRKALLQLGLLGDKSPKFINMVINLLSQPTNNNNEILQVHALMGLGGLGKTKISGELTTDKLIIDAVEGGDKGGLLARLKPLRSNKSPRVLRVACETLGVIGDKSAKSCIQRLSRSSNEEVAEHAAAAWERIKKRLK